jgi:hypothetical protein
MNTGVPEDQACMESLAAEYPWISVVTHPQSNPSAGIGNIHWFFRGCTDKNSAYLRLDDDIVWLEPGFLNRMFEFRVAHPQYFLVYANIINNAIVSHIHERSGRVWSEAGRAGYECTCPVAWNNPAYALDVHTAFLASIRAGTVNDWHFPLWKLYHYERVSINCICWLGADFAEFGGQVGTDEEVWLACVKPRESGRMNVIYGGACCVHYAFFTQRPGLDATGVLAEYQSLSEH